MLAELDKDVRDAFGEPPRMVMLLFAMTELKLLAAIYGIDKIIKHDPDVILTVRDAARVQTGMTGAPGSLRLVDEHTLYFRPPAVYLESETLLLVLRNLLRKAYDREKTGEPSPIPTPNTGNSLSLGRGRG